MSATTEPGALARLFELHDKTPALLTADDWAAARLEFSQYSIALRTIAQMWDGESVPEAETYDDTESAYNNGHDVASYEAAKLAREAIAGASIPSVQEPAAMQACRLLVEAYRRGEQSGGSIEWEDLDEAHEAALAALRGEAGGFDQELLDLARRKLVEFHAGRVTLTREGYLAITRLFGRS